MLHKPLEELRPLSGLTVVSLAVNLPGPVAAARLRDLGARIVKIEPPGGDPLAHFCPDLYRTLHADVSIVPLDLKAEADRKRVLELLEGADLFLTSLRPESLVRLGLSWSELHARFPRLCHVAIVGQAPPEENRPGHDLTYQAALGLVSPPDLPRSLLADMGGAEQAVTASVALLLMRERGQEAQAAYVSLSEAARQLGGPHHHGLTMPSGLLGGASPVYNVYRASEGWVAVAALEPHFAQRLARQLDIETLTPDCLAAAFLRRTADEWQLWAEAHDLPIAAIKNVGLISNTPSPNRSED